MSLTSTCPLCGAKVLTKASKCHACDTALRDAHGRRLDIGPHAREKAELDQIAIQCLANRTIPVERREYHNETMLAWLALCLPAVSVFAALFVILILFVANPLFGIFSFIMLLTILTPLFSMSGGGQASERELAAQEEPRLYYFVKLLCDALGTPQPDRIVVTCDVNAYASRQHGRFTLSLGMPLVGGLDAAQLGGIIAHELGHFTQSASWVVTRLRWLAAWYAIGDECPEATFPTRFTFLHPLWQRYCRTMARLTGMVSGKMMQEMEYEADRFEIMLAGTESFTRTTRCIQALARSQEIYSRVRDFSHDGVFPNNLPRLIVTEALQLDDKGWAEIDKEIHESSTKPRDTHPADRDRIGQAYELKTEGSLRTSHSATLLFNDFDAVCEQVTLDIYRSAFGKGFDADSMTSIQQTEAKLAEEQMLQDAVKTFFAAKLLASRPPRLRLDDVSRAADPKAAAKDWLQSYQSSVSNAGDFEVKIASWVAAEEKLQEANVRIVLHDAEITLPGEAESTMRKLKGKFDGLASACDACDQELEPLESELRLRMSSALSLAFTPNLAPHIQETDVKQLEIKSMAPVWNALLQLAPSRQKLGMQVTALAILGESSQQVRTEDDAGFYLRTVRKQFRELLATLNAISLRTDRVDFPFPSSAGHKSLSDYLGHYGPGMSEEEVAMMDEGVLYKRATDMMERYDRLVVRVLGKLSVVANEVEAVLIPRLVKREVKADG